MSYPLGYQLDARAQNVFSVEGKATVCLPLSLNYSNMCLLNLQNSIHRISSVDTFSSSCFLWSMKHRVLSQTVLSFIGKISDLYLDSRVAFRVTQYGSAIVLPQDSACAILQVAASMPSCQVLRDACEECCARHFDYCIVPPATEFRGLEVSCLLRILQVSFSHMKANPRTFHSCVTWKFAVTSMASSFWEFMIVEIITIFGWSGSIQIYVLHPKTKFWMLLCYGLPTEMKYMAGMMPTAMPTTWSKIICLGSERKTWSPCYLLCTSHLYPFQFWRWWASFFLPQSKEMSFLVLSGLWGDT